MNLFPTMGHRDGGFDVVPVNAGGQGASFDTFSVRDAVQSVKHMNFSINSRWMV